jgi:ribosome-binding ATPase YchF (GTP1/OBG family)
MQPAESLVLTSAISETFLRRLAAQNYVKYIPGSDNVSTCEDLVEEGDPDGGGLKEMDEKLRTRLENCKDMVLYRFGSTGVVEVLRRAGEMLGLVGVFPVKNIHSFGAGGGTKGGGTSAEDREQKVFRDCVLVKKGTTIGEVGRKIMGDVPIAFVETVGGVRVGDEDTVEVGRNDVSSWSFSLSPYRMLTVWCRYSRLKLAELDALPLIT